MATQTNIDTREVDSGLSSLMNNIVPVNPLGRDQTSLQNEQKALEDIQKQLRERYERPNFFKVAAGFMKPQLGGFSASLGSAADAMGDTEEQSRANVLPMAAVRSKLALNATIQDKLNKAQAYATEWHRQNKGPMGEKEIAYLNQLDATGTVAAAEQKGIEARSTNVGADSTAVRTAADAAQAQAGIFGFKAPTNLSTSNPLENIMTDQQMNAVNADLIAKLVSIDKTKTPADFAGRSRDELAKELAARQDVVSQKGYENQVDGAKEYRAAQADLRTIQQARAYLADPKVVTALGSGTGGQSFLNIAVQAFTGTNPDLKRNAEAVLMKMASNDPATYSKLEALGKALAQNELQIRSSTANPTDAAGNLASAASPTMFNSPMGMKKVLDSIAFQKSAAAALGRNMVEYKGNSFDADTSPERISLQAYLAKQQENLANADEDYAKAPIYYDTSSLYKDWQSSPRAGQPTVATPTTPSAAPRGTAGGNTAGSVTERLRAIAAARQAAASAPR
jgi:hypothetical protein